MERHQASSNKSVEVAIQVTTGALTAVSLEKMWGYTNFEKNKPTHTVVPAKYL